ncbi:hypothetical protein MUO66_10495 [Candidatus Bathyarchaeota archaeon]|nr:hypothetical protein [Candidatus Bathyarchaeota archaeon]
MHSNFKTLIVSLILNKKTEEALIVLAKKYNVTIPKLKVGLPKGHKKNTLGCYITKNSTITVHNGDLLFNPHVILHEFYHHLRTNIEKTHKGTEKNANKFALDFIREYRVSTQE